MFYDKNKSLLNLVTSTGVILITEDHNMMFYDKYSGFVLSTYEQDNTKCYFMNNLHHHIAKFPEVEIYYFYYYYPMIINQTPLSVLFKEVLYDLHSLKDFNDFKYKSFLWKVGKLQLDLPTKIKENNILEEMRKIHGEAFIPEDY